MIVISDTSVVTNLIQLDQLSLLQQLFGDIILPQKVFEDYQKSQIKSISLKRPIGLRSNKYLIRIISKD